MMSHSTIDEADRTRALARWTRRMVRYRWIVVFLWLVVLAFSGVATSKLTPLLANRFSVPGSEAERADRLTGKHFEATNDGAFNIVIVADEGTPVEALVGEAAAAAERAAELLPEATIGEPAVLDERTVEVDVTTPFEAADMKGYVPDVREAVGDIPGAEEYVAGSPAFTYDVDPVAQEGIAKGLRLTMPIALVILALVFTTLGLFMPFLFAVAAIPATLGIVYLFARHMDLSSYSINLVEGIGLGIAIDYSLLIYSRYREERARHDAQVDAIVDTMLTAGRAVIFSGTAVAIGLALLLLMPMPFMRGFGVVGLLIPLVSVLCALTLLPALLAILADKLERVRVVPRGLVPREHDDERNGWARLARWIMRRPIPFFTLSVVVLLALAAPTLDLEITPGTTDGVPRSVESMQGAEALTRAVGRGATLPTQVVVDGGAEGAAAGPQVQQAINALVADLRADEEVARVAWDPQQPTIDATGRYALINIVGEHEYGEDEAGDLVRRIRSEYIPAAGLPRDAEASVGGWPALGVDLIKSTYDAFPWLVAAVLALTYLLLMRAFRSLLLPLKAIVLNMLSIGAAYGVLQLVWGTALAENLGLTVSPEIEFWIPVFMFAMLFGLSMDYEVFLVSRMREEWDASHDNERAVALGLARTGRLVTAAGLIMVAAFAGFLVVEIAGLQQFGLGLAAAILIDITLVRALLLPSAMKLFGRWNWWLPASVARVVRVAPSPLAPR